MAINAMKSPVAAWCIRVTDARIRHFDTPPRAVLPENLRFYMLLNLAHTLAWAAHLLWGVVFFKLGLTPLALLQPLSIGLYVLAIWLNRLGRHMLSMCGSIVWLVAHAALAVWLVGRDAGFQYCILVAALFPFLLTQGRIAGKLLLLAYSALGFLLIEQFAAAGQPLYRLPQETVQALHIANILSVFIGVTMLAIYLTISVRRSEQAIRQQSAAAVEAVLAARLAEEVALRESYHRELAGFRAAQQTVVSEASIQKLRGATLLTDEQWADFRNSFEEAHPGFLSRLRVKMPDLTPAEVRFVVLSKLQMDAKDMAAMLGVGPAAIRKYRFRLRAKLNLPADSPIEELVAVI